MTWVKGDAEAIRQKENEIESIRRVLNLSLSPLELYYSCYRTPRITSTAKYTPFASSNEERDRIHGVFINRQIDLDRLMVAAVRYQRAVGRWPAAIGDLVPKYIDSAIVIPAKIRYQVFSYPLVRAKDAATTGSLSKSGEVPLFFCGEDREFGQTWEVWFPYSKPVANDLRGLVRRR